MKKCAILLFLLITLKENMTAQKNITVMFYNVENFFDIKDDPKINDSDYLPNSDLEWNLQKYENKIKRIAEVIDSGVAGVGLPDIVGFCEVENKQVLIDLVVKSQLKTKPFTAICATGQDERGINVGLIYDSNLFELLKSEEINSIDPAFPKNKTRNVLFVTLRFKTTNEKIYLFVNHWPSRRDGEAETESKRIYSAKVVRGKIDLLLKENPNAKIIVMGDLNDTPMNTSVQKVLKANASPKAEAGELLNPYFNFEKRGEGTHYHEGEWDVFDNIILSPEFLLKKGLTFKGANAYILKKDFLLFKNHRTGEQKPNRTYSGMKYHNGYSDHLAVYITLNY
jgi:predicted extracellular nuclease